MPEHNDKQPAEPDFSSTEGNLFGALFSFHEKTTDLLRKSSLDDDKLNLATGRIKALLEDATAEMKQTRDFSNLASRLEAAYAQVTRLVDELSDPDRESSTEQFILTVAIVSPYISSIMNRATSLRRNADL